MEITRIADHVARGADPTAERIKGYRSEELVGVAGQGFDAAAARGGRLGMTTMRERADAVGGRLSVES